MAEERGGAGGGATARRAFFGAFRPCGPFRACRAFRPFGARGSSRSFWRPRRS
ncbi:hypothetical protein [Streptomyces endocoffeicus]|uniref:hypothetical protein n=1 Tax=Streptomyces endocoffeicus TaxID=2898945 RepID=UPI001E2DBF6A|nr:hypothetical protein [Streptomyces endocoffeicus]